MTHTKGKWFTVELDGEIDIASQLTETMQSPSIATVLPVSGVLNKIGGGSTQANANLIANAPAMLEALNKINDLELDSDITDHETALRVWARSVGRIAREAIAKAEAS